MATVKFMKGIKANYDGLATKDNATLYFVTNPDNELEFYLGSKKIADYKALADVISDVSSIKNAFAGINYTAASDADTILSVIEDAVGDLDDLTTTAKTNAVAAINEVKSAVATLTTGSTISVTEVTEGLANGILKAYQIRQGAASQQDADSNIVATINIPKDLVVTSGTVVTIVDEGGTLKNKETGVADTDAPSAGTFIRLVIANQTAPLYVNAADLVDVYTAAQNATQVQLAISNNVISASIVAGSIGTTELSTAVNTSLGKADSAVQTVAEGSTNGTVAVDGTDVAVHGLGSAAYTESTAYDASGAAASAKSDVIGTSSDAATADTINGAKKYTDDALTWGDIPTAGA